MQHMYPGEKNYDFHTVRLTRMSKGRIDCVQSFCVCARNGSTGEDEFIHHPPMILSVHQKFQYLIDQQYARWVKSDMHAVSGCDSNNSN